MSPSQPVETPIAPAGTCVISLNAELLHFDYEADAFRSEGEDFDAQIILADRGNFNCESGLVDMRQNFNGC